MYTDEHAYIAYPNLRHFYNKLWLSEKLGYNCGPSGIAPSVAGWYIVRPIMNLSGMGVGAKKIWIAAGDSSKVPPGYFWSEWFPGNQYSATFKTAETSFQQVSCFKGFKEEYNLSQFIMWKKDTDLLFEMPVWLQEELKDVPFCNIEFIGSKIIEVHLRMSPDPDHDILVPVWDYVNEMIDIYSKMGYSYITSYDNADGFLENPRYGFMVK